MERVQIWRIDMQIRTLDLGMIECKLDQLYHMADTTELLDELEMYNIMMTDIYNR